jgi:hypothetical protein
MSRLQDGEEKVDEVGEGVQKLAKERVRQIENHTTTRVEAVKKCPRLISWGPIVSPFLPSFPPLPLAIFSSQAKYAS